MFVWLSYSVFAIMTHAVQGEEAQDQYEVWNPYIDAVVRQQADANGYARSLLNRIKLLEQELASAKKDRDDMAYNITILLDQTQTLSHCNLSHDHALMMDQQREIMQTQHHILERNTTYVATDVTYDMYYGTIMGVMLGMLILMVVGFALYCIVQQDTETARRRETHRLAMELAAVLRTQDTTPQSMHTDAPPPYNMAVTTTVTTSV